MNRRGFLIAAWASALVPALAGGASGAELFSDPGAAARLGARYLAALAPSRRRGETIAALALARGVAGMAPRSRRAQIAAAIRRDFAEGAIVTIDGWMLARSEARLCASAYLEARIPCQPVRDGGPGNSRA
jgi:soluble lytic murein transglycosylase-like protein